MHGKRSPKAHHWSERIVRQIKMGRGEGRGMLCVHACNGWEQCHNVLQSFGECHNVTWPICVSAMFRGITNPQVTSIAMKRSPVDCCNNAIERMYRVKQTDRKCPKDH